MSAICVLRDASQEVKGVVRFFEIGENVVLVKAKVWGISEGYHGIHIHSTGNILEGPHSLCDHFDPYKTGVHGDLNGKNHAGDLGNIYIDREGIGLLEVRSKFLKLKGNTDESIYGRSVIVHAGKDDLGKGKYSDSLTTGHSGDRILYGVIGIDGGTCHV